MPQFHETGYGQTFFQSQLPRLIKNLGRIADSLESQGTGNSELKDFINSINDTVEGRKDTPDVMPTGWLEGRDYAKNKILGFLNKN